MLRAKITYQDFLKAEAKNAEVKFGDILAENMILAVFRWHGLDLPKHFKQGAKQLYGYADRKKGYMMMKARAFHHQQDLVLRGNLRDMLTKSSAIKVSATKQGKSAK